MTAGATEAIAAAILALVEPRRRGGRARAVLRLLRRVHRDGRRRTPPGDPARPRLPARRRRAPGRRHRPAPRRCCSTPRTTRPARCSPATSSRPSPRWRIEHDLVVVTDEVYEHLLFDGRAHVPICTLPGMCERTVTISSAGKTFSFTGWKVGWVTGPADLVGAVMAAKQWLTFTYARPAAAGDRARAATTRRLLRRAGHELQDKRDLLVRRACASWGSTCSARGDVLRHHRHAGARLRRRDGVLPRAAGAGRRRRDPERRCSTTTRTRAATWCAGRSARRPPCSRTAVQRLRKADLHA